MAQLSDTQLIILSNAAQHPDHIALPLPERLKGGATKIVVGSLLAKSPSGGFMRFPRALRFCAP
jgi:hypothetical protein